MEPGVFLSSTLIRSLHSTFEKEGLQNRRQVESHLEVQLKLTKQIKLLHLGFMDIVRFMTYKTL